MRGSIVDWRREERDAGRGGGDGMVIWVNLLKMMFLL